MADSTAYVHKYAQAFASVASRAGLDQAAAQQQLRDFAATYASSYELREVFEDPSVPSDQKLAVLDGLAARIGMMREVRNFVAVMMDGNRLSGLGEILAAYHQLADASKGVVEAEVISVHELTAEDRAQMESEVARLARSAVRITYRQDSSLIGGAVIRIGSTVYDGSVRAQLEQMKKTLLTAS